MKTIGFILSPDMAVLFFERVVALEKGLGRTMGKRERQALLLEMTSRKEAEAFTSDECPEMVERKFMRAGAAYLGRNGLWPGHKKPPEREERPEGLNPEIA